MDKLLELVDQPTTAAATTQEMDENLFKEFLTKNSVWDFHNMTRDEYNKTSSEKQLLIVNYYNEMLKGKNQFPFFFICLFF